MNKFLSWIALFLIGTGMNASEEQKIKDALTFGVNFTLSQTEFKAQFAAGDPIPQVLHEPKARVDFEPMATINNGLLVGDGCASLRFSSAKNLNDENGSIELVVKSMDWDWDDTQKHIFMQSLGKEATLYIYKHAGDGFGAYVGIGKKHFFPRKQCKNWKKNEKHHFLLTYAGEKIQLFLDGSLVNEGVIPDGKVKFGKYFELGPAGKFGRDGRSVISCANFYNRALTGDEVALLAKKHLPNLEIVSKVKDTRQIMAPSPFFANPEKLGLEALNPDYVPFPWTPVKFANDKIEVWNRVYDLHGDAFLTQVTTGNEALLEKAANFSVTLNGKQIPLQFSKPQVLSQKDGKLEIDRKIIAPKPLSGSAIYTFEYDGAMFVKLAFDNGTLLEDLKLDIPYANASMIHYVGRMENSLRSVVAPDFSYSKTLSKGNGTVWNGEFHPCVHLGSLNGGLQYFSESDQYFWPKKRDTIFEVKHNSGKYNLSVNYTVGKMPLKSAQKIEYRFGLMATPVRPMPANWRSFTITAQYDSHKGKDRGNILVYWPDEWVQMDLDPDPTRAQNTEKLKQKIIKDHAENRKIIPYYSRLHLPCANDKKINPDGAFARQNWGQDPQRQVGHPTRDWTRCTSTTAWSDYLVWCVANYSKLFGHVDGFYMDEMEPTPNLDGKTGGGYDDLDGTRRPTYTLMADREMYKRMNYVLAKQNNYKENFSIAHCSGTYIMPFLSHFNIFLVAEHLYSGYFPDRKDLLPPENDRLYYYSYALPMDRVKTEFYYRPWGNVIGFLPCLKNQRDIMTKVEPTRDLLSRIQHGDVIIWPLWCNSKEVHKTWKFREEFEIGNPEVKFVPYWDNSLINSQDADFAVSYYVQKDHYLVIVSNLKREAAEINLTFDKSVLIKSVKNAETLTDIQTNQNQIKLQVKRNDYTALRINY